MTNLPAIRSSERISAATSLLLIVDVQERLIPKIVDHADVVDGCLRLIRAASVCEIPITATEQYPAGLGPTVPAISQALQNAAGSPAPAVDPCRIVEKLRFSAAEATGWPAAGDRDDDRIQVVVAGIEAHICVLQTALDLMAGGYRVAVAADATGSRRSIDRDIAWNRLRDSGAILTTVESVLFEWCEQAGTDRFRMMRDLVKK